MKVLTGEYLINKEKYVKLASSMMMSLLYLLVIILPAANAVEINKPTEQIRIIVEEFVPGGDMRGEIVGIPSSICDRYKVVVYVRTDKWYIHPFAAGGDGNSYSVVDSSCGWSIITVKRYPVPKEVAVLLVDKDQNSPGQLFSLEQVQYHALVVQKWKEIEASERGSYAETLQGATGSSVRWASGWLDLSKAVDFQKGDKVRLIVGGGAERIIVRFLTAGVAPDAPVGFEGGIIKVPKNRMIEITLNEDHRDVVQISVHGGVNPWGVYPLGGMNGSATLLQAELLRK